MAARENKDQLNELLGRYRSYLQYLAGKDWRMKMLQSKVDESDIVQVTMIEASKSFVRFDGAHEPQFTAWLRSILIRVIHNEARKYQTQKREIGLEQNGLTSESASLPIYNLPGGDSGPVSRTIKGESAILLLQAIDDLPPDQAQAVSLRHLEQKSVTDIATEMNRSTTAVAGLLQRGLKRLRSRLKDI